LSFLNRNWRFQTANCGRQTANRRRRLQTGDELWETKELAEQPWRNPRPAPPLEEIRQRVPAKNFVPQFLRSWWPALLWAGVIFSMSSDTFSSNHTASILYPILHWMRPSLTFQQFDVIHYFIRKSAHFTEYFVFCLLLFRGVRGGRAGWRWTWALAALSIAAGYSMLDEIHQSFVTSRMASPWDSLLDSAGAFVATLVIFLWFRFRKTERH
jgi:VanZ family protein